MQHVRQAIAQSHDTIEQTEFAKSLMDGRITREAYGVYLAQMRDIHQTLEDLLPQQACTAEFFRPSMMRTASIDRDARALGLDLHAQPTLAETLRIIEDMRGWKHAAPYALLGCLYILEGSRMGSMVIGRALIKHLSLQPAEAHVGTDGRMNATVPGVEYHLEDVAQTPSRVRDLKAAIDSAGLTEDQVQQLVTGACSFMQSLLDLYTELPLTVATSVNRTPRCPFAHGDQQRVVTPMDSVSQLRSA